MTLSIKDEIRYLEDTAPNVNYTDLMAALSIVH